MKFVRGMPVFAEAEPFGTVVDLVVDSFTNQVSHVVVDPNGNHQQSRLVPLWLVNEADKGLRISLPDTHVRQLQRCLESDYARKVPETPAGVDLRGFRSVLTLPYFRDEAITNGSDSSVGIPRSSCEIRRSSWVVGQANYVLGTVAGFIVNGDMIHSLIVRSGLVGHRHHVAVPIGNVETVSSHFLSLSLDREGFKQAPLTTVMKFGLHFVRPKELWREVLGHPTDRLWDSFEMDELPKSSKPDAGTEMDR